jgi:large subunit ribosomal protein L2
MVLNFLKVGQNKSSGRNSRTGRREIFHRGGGFKRNYRIIDLSRILKNELSVVFSFLVDPGRTATLAACLYRNEIIVYVLACKGLTLGDVIANCYRFPSSKVLQKKMYLYPAFSKPGFSDYLVNFSIGAFVHGVMFCGFKIFANHRYLKMGQYIRAAGGYAQLLKKKPYGGILRFRSGEHRLFFNRTITTFGVVVRHKFLETYKVLKRKAGRMRLLGRRPKVRGCAMNPVDHPQGGGAGRRSGKRGAFSPWGKFSKGTHTAAFKFKSKSILKSRYEK